MNYVEVSTQGSIEPPSWASRCGAFVRKVMDRLSIHDEEVSIVLCDNAFIRDLNRDYRGIDEPTDVLSFEQRADADPAPAHARASLVGDIVISTEMVRENAERFCVSEDEELKRLLIHGLLHLQGMNHRDNSPEEEMLKLQESILSELQGEQVL